ncbi:MAG TPA: CYTH and CHAD domain-containing protein [Gaiellaceae bacterium]|nr:CYTH and CHAD domain-containing protein [Gaiellaceae bacterium]
MALRETLEREVKLRADADFRLPELGGEPLEPRLFVSTYHDTADHRLARRGITLRHRSENGKAFWQLKLPRGRARLELERAGGPAAPPEELLGLLAGHLRGESLVPVARLRTRRIGIRADGAEVVHDHVDVLEHQRVTRTFDELEVELLDGNEKTLRRLERELRRAGAATGETRPKLFQALDLDFQPEREQEPGDRTPAGVLRAHLRLNAERLLAHDPGTRLATDEGELHQLRVAARRLRALLRAGRELLDPEAAEVLRAELGWLGGALGPVRDLDVLIAHLREGVEALTADAAAGIRLVRALERERRKARRALTAAMASARYFALLDALEAPIATVAERPGLREIHADAHRRLRKAAGSLGDEPSDEALHAVRLRAKRARYAAELAGLGGYVRAAKRLQDVLGEHQDAVVAESRLRALAAADPAAALAAGRLVEGERLRAAAARSEWKDAWKRLSKVA